MAGRPRKKLTPQEQEARREGLERRAKREAARREQRAAERADRQARRQLRREREAKKKREADALAARRAALEPWPLDVFREGLALARRAGMPWHQAYHPAWEAALSVADDKDERGEWACVLHDTRTAWMRAYERRPTGYSL